MNTERKETLSRRERVKRAIERRPVDRMPIDLGCHYSTGISAFAYQNLRRHLGLDASNVEVIDPGQFLARVDMDIIERFHLDAIVLHPGYPKTARWSPREGYDFLVPERMNPRLQPDGAWHIFRDEVPDARSVMPRGGFFFDGDGGVDMWGLDSDEWWRVFSKEAERIHKETDFFTMLCGFPGYFGDIEECCEMYAEPEAFKKKNAERLRYAKGRFDMAMKHMGGWFDSIELNGDLGTQSAPYVSEDVYEECTLPFLKEFCDYVHDKADVKCFMHCCGSMRPLIPHLIEGGVDVINPVQISAADMDPAEIKGKYGDKIAFWGGGCDTQNVLGVKTPEEVAANVRELTDVFARNSGFVFNQVHNVMGNVPPENIVAMLDTAYEQSWKFGTLK